LFFFEKIDLGLDKKFCEVKKNQKQRLITMSSIQADAISKFSIDKKLAMRIFHFTFSS